MTMRTKLHIRNAAEGSLAAGRDGGCPFFGSGTLFVASEARSRNDTPP